MLARLVVLGSAVAVLGLAAPPRGAAPVHRAQDVCVKVVVSGTVNRDTGDNCVPTPMETDPFHTRVEGAVVYVDFYVTYP